MTTVTIHEAKTHLSRLIKQVLAGEEVIVARGREEVIKLVPLKPVAKPRRIPGRFAHLAPAGGILDHGFWDPLPDDMLGLTDDSE